MPDLDLWDVSHELLNCERKLFEIKEALERYGWEGHAKEADALGKTLYSFRHELERYGTPENWGMQDVPRAETSVQRETDKA